MTTTSLSKRSPIPAYRALSRTAQIQEVRILLGQMLCGATERRLDLVGP
jgi:hypothetical protein